VVAAFGSKTGEEGGSPARYGTHMRTIGRGGVILNGGRGKVAQGEGEE
jgi:hypothetical protein